MLRYIKFLNNLRKAGGTRAVFLYVKFKRVPFSYFLDTGDDASIVIWASILWHQTPIPVKDWVEITKRLKGVKL